MYTQSTIDELLEEIKEMNNNTDISVDYNEPNKQYEMTVNGNVYVYNDVKEVINTLMMLQDNFLDF